MIKRGPKFLTPLFIYNLSWHTGYKAVTLIGEPQMKLPLSLPPAALLMPCTEFCWRPVARACPSEQALTLPLWAHPFKVLHTHTVFSMCHRGSYTLLYSLVLSDTYLTSPPPFKILCHRNPNSYFASFPTVDTKALWSEHCKEDIHRRVPFCDFPRFCSEISSNASFNPAPVVSLLVCSAWGRAKSI